MLKQAVQSGPFEFASSGCLGLWLGVGSWPPFCSGLCGERCGLWGTFMTRTGWTGLPFGFGAVAVWDILPGKAHRKLGNLREAIADADEAGKGWGNFSALAGCMQSDPQEEANFHGDLAGNLFICNLASDVLQIAYTTLAWRRFRDWPGIARMPQFLRSPGTSGSGRVRWVGQWFCSEFLES